MAVATAAWVGRVVKMEQRKKPDDHLACSFAFSRAGVHEWQLYHHYHRFWDAIVRLLNLV